VRATAERQSAGEIRSKREGEGGRERDFLALPWSNWIPPTAQALRALPALLRDQGLV
jgi:hypothetical protein